MFSDECSVEKGKGKKRQWAFGTPAQKWDKDKIKTHNKSKGISVMVWGGIGGTVGRTELIIMTRDEESANTGYTAVSYTETLEQGLLPVYNSECFVQDNAPNHTAGFTKAWFEEKGVFLLMV